MNFNIRNFWIRHFLSYLRTILIIQKMTCYIIPCILSSILWFGKTVYWKMTNHGCIIVRLYLTTNSLLKKGKRNISSRRPPYTCIWIINEIGRPIKVINIYIKTNNCHKDTHFSQLSAKLGLQLENCIIHRNTMANGCLLRLLRS